MYSCLELHLFFQDLKCALEINFEVFKCLNSRLGLHLFFSRPHMWFRKKNPSSICKATSVREKKRKDNEERRSEHALLSFEIYYNYYNKKFDMDGFKLWCYRWCYFLPFFSWRNVEEAWWVFLKVRAICILQVYQETWNNVANSRLKG